MDTFPPASDAEIAAAREVGYTYTDPVTDDAFPRIVETTDDMLDEFPEGWGEQPTWRDRQAIDAGNG